MNGPDWNLVRAFHATVESGSLSAAAKALGLSQPTLSRQIAALEASLGSTLFERIGKRLELTDAGRALTAYAAAMGQAAQSFALTASGQSEAMEGTVSVSASDAVAFYLLPPVIERIRTKAPGITIDILVSNELSDLRRREADIAIRHVRPTEPELTARLLREATASFYASTEWVRRNGHPRTAADGSGATFIGADPGDRYAGYLRALGIDVQASNIPIRTENSLVAWDLARRGLGIAAIMDDIARTLPDMVRVLDEVPQITFPFWLVAHRELHTARRIRVVFDLIAEGLKTT
jgi:DNA-binding transcriptional LysR family regulator